jgi:hypothetical protein
MQEKQKKTSKNMPLKCWDLFFSEFHDFYQYFLQNNSVIPNSCNRVLFKGFTIIITMLCFHLSLVVTNSM